MKLSAATQQGRLRRGRSSYGLALLAPRTQRRRRGAGFTLLEVMVAFAIFFMVAFTILELTTRSLAAARALQQREPDPGLIAAMYSLTNQLIEGVEQGNFEDLYPGVYPNWSWATDVVEYWSNGLFRVDIVVYRDAKHGPSQSKLSVLFYRPESPPGKASTGGLGL